MTVAYKTWPYGTVKPCTVLAVEHAGGKTFLGCESGGEGYICVYRRGTVEAEVGDRGTLTFTEGGPTGGYWQFAREARP